MADNIYGDGSTFYVVGTTGDDVLVALKGGTQLDGGAGRDHLNGSSGHDVLTGGKGNDFLWGGAGNDTFLWHASDLSDDNATVDMVYDFEGAGVASGDDMIFYGFGEGSTFTTDGRGQVLPDGRGTIYKYTLYDAASGHSETIMVTSTNGKLLTTDDFHFYSSVPV
ncbi:hypothetical protein WBP06_01445 [Novosphingobium sp. BL-8H]|uniref:hypothetical protein n=1 Tax=Novosphingobium sp. BL-8H TaxID=3127640 RepID=UPI0037574C64